MNWELILIASLVILVELQLLLAVRRLTRKMQEAIEFLKNLLAGTINKKEEQTPWWKKHMQKLKPSL